MQPIRISALKTTHAPNPTPPQHRGFLPSEGCFRCRAPLTVYVESSCSSICCNVVRIFMLRFLAAKNEKIMPGALHRFVRIYRSELLFRNAYIFIHFVVYFVCFYTRLFTSLIFLYWNLFSFFYKNMSLKFSIYALVAGR